MITSRPVFLLGLFLAGQSSFGSPPRKPAANLPAALSISTNGNELSFDKKTLEAKAGEPVVLTFKNAADVGSGMKHTWVLVKPGTSDKVASEAVEAGAGQNYTPKDPDVLAATPLVAPGKSETIRFTAPHEPGTYPYICTVPGHSRSLHGELVVK